MPATSLLTICSLPLASGRKSAARTPGLGVQELPPGRQIRLLARGVA
jgi:hypothetical protein